MADEPLPPFTAEAREIVAAWRIGYGETIRRGEGWTEMVEAVRMGFAAARGIADPNALPADMPGHWDTAEGRGIVVEYATRTRESLCHGDKSDLVIANAVFMADRRDMDLIVWQTAAKERIRWLSAQLAMARAALP